MEITKCVILLHILDFCKSLSKDDQHAKVMENVMENVMTNEPCMCLKWKVLTECWLLNIMDVNGAKEGWEIGEILEGIFHPVL